MKITGIRAWLVPLTSHIPYYMAEGKSCDTVDTVVLAIDTDKGRTGWGEVCPIPHYLPAYAKGVVPALHELAPVLIGADPLGAETLMHKLDAWLPGHGYAKSAIDTALWDLSAQVADMPLYRLLGGRATQSLPLYHSISCLAPDEMGRIAAEAQRTGINQFQVKLGADNNWQTDVERMRKVRETVGAGPLVYGDWNAGASKLDAIRVGRALSDGDFMLEQPCATLEDCAAVREATGLPMKLDESAHDTESLLRAYRLGCLDAVAIKLSKFGGLSAARRARDLCLHLGPVMCIEDTWGSDITTAALLHLAASTPRRAIMNSCDLSGYASPRLDSAGPTRADGHIAPPESPGLGVSPDPDSLGQPLALID